MIQFDSGEKPFKQQEHELKTLPAKIKVLGIGGAGCSILARVHSENWLNIDFTACDSSIRALSECPNLKTIAIGESLTRGWGTGGDREIAKKAAQEAEDKIKDLLQGVDLLFVVCSLGKGLGAGASPIFFQVAREMGIVSIGFFILPFSFEGNHVLANAQNALAQLWQLVDGAVVVSNDFLPYAEQSGTQSLPLKEVFSRIDLIFESLLRSVSAILYQPALISLDFADIRSLLMQGKRLIITTGQGSGEEYLQVAVEKLFHSPVWGEISLDKAKGVLLIVKSSEEFKLSELQKIVLSLHERALTSIPVSLAVYAEKDLSNKLAITLLITSEENQSVAVTKKSDGAYQQELGLEVYNQKDLDVPTFLRKKHQN